MATDHDSTQGRHTDFMHLGLDGLDRHITLVWAYACPGVLPALVCGGARCVGPGWGFCDPFRPRWPPRDPANRLWRAHPLDAPACATPVASITTRGEQPGHSRRGRVMPALRAMLWLPGDRPYQRPTVDRRAGLVSLSPLGLLLRQARQASGAREAPRMWGSQEQRPENVREAPWHKTLLSAPFLDVDFCHGFLHSNPLLAPVMTQMLSERTFVGAGK
jgi:hypothetical protein